MSFTLIKQPTFTSEGLEIVEFDYLHNPGFQEYASSVYGQFNPAQNAKNELCRAVRWGIFLNDTITFSNKNTYQLSAELNPEEAGQVRTMDLIPDSFLGSQQIQQLIREVFSLFYPNSCSYEDAYVIQLSALRYAPTPAKACYPSPDMPHQDGFNNGIVVLNMTPNVVGGMTRVYDLDGSFKYQAKLSAGQGVFVQDDQWMHQVEPMLIDTSKSGSYDECYRDIMIVRIDLAKR